jgi:hypothetical protein
MNLETVVLTIKSHLTQMDEFYGKTVFDEWAVVSVFDRKARILHYTGARREDLQRTFAEDVKHFVAELVAGRQHVGHFDFSRDAGGQQYDAYLVLGEGCYLVCNNTTQSMGGITKDPRWLRAQVPFAELADKVRSDPLMHFA